MDTIFKFLYEFLGQFFASLWSIFVGIGKGIAGMFNFPAYGNIISDYTTDIRSAIIREKQIKGWRRSKKNDLINSQNPEWKDLSQFLL